MCRFKGKGFLKSWAAALMIGGSFGLASQECAEASEVVPLMTA